MRKAASFIAETLWVPRIGSIGSIRKIFSLIELLACRLDCFRVSHRPLIPTQPCSC